MRRIREVLRLKHECGYSQRDISASLYKRHEQQVERRRGAKRKLGEDPHPAREDEALALVLRAVVGGDEDQLAGQPQGPPPVRPLATLRPLRPSRKRYAPDKA